MLAKRLRISYSAEQVAEIYQSSYDHTRWEEHKMRIRVTAAIANGIVDRHRLLSAADLSCGDGAIIKSLNVSDRYLGDITTGQKFSGPIMKTIREVPEVGIFICTETIEHIDWPEDLLLKIREKSQHLVLSTPIGAWGDKNPEHYWAWDREYIDDMLRTVGFSVQAFASLDCRTIPGQGYEFGIWGCSR